MYAEPTRFEHREEVQEASNPLSSSSDDEAVRRARMEPRFRANSNDFRVKIPEFEAKLDLDEFLEWMTIVERIFEYKEVLEDKKVKLVSLKLRKYALLWGTNLCSKRARNHKSRI